MATTGSRLKKLREAAEISQRELARRIGEDHSNVRFWESSDTLPRSNVLVAMAKALDVTVDELLGQPKPASIPRGRLGEVVKTITSLPRRQQNKVLDLVEPYVQQQATSKAA